MDDSCSVSIVSEKSALTLCGGEPDVVQKIGSTQPAIGSLSTAGPHASAPLGKATEKKLIRNAFQIGDAWVNTGDLVAKQGSDHILFVDRIGDTFRWKGQHFYD